MNVTLMTQQFKNYRFLGIIILIVTAMMAFQVAGQSQPVFRVGILAEEDSALARGAVLAAQQINTAGGVRGADGTQFLLELIAAPVNETTTTEGAVAQLLAANVIAVIGPETTTELSTVLPTLQQLNVPILTTATGDNVITSDTSNLVFRVRATDFLIARGLAEVLIRDNGVNSISLYQFDAESTVNAIGFQNAAQGFGIGVAPPQLVATDDDIAAATQAVLTANPQAIVAYGPPTIAGDFYQALRDAGFEGLFAYSRPNHPDFAEDIAPESFTGVIGANSWSFAAVDEASTEFTLDYLRRYRTIPTAVSAASADAVYLLEEAIGMPGELRTNLTNIQGIVGVQGLLSPVNLNPGETSDNVSVFQFDPNGSLDVVARFVGSERLAEVEEDEPIITPTPTATATPAGVVATIISNVQNVRSGPSTDFEVIGQLDEGEQVQIIGATTDFSWLVIQFRGQQGWIANLSNLNEIFGDLNSVPIITPPATPTPRATSTPAPTLPPQEPDLVIQSVSVSPNPIRPNEQFTIQITVANVGLSNAGQFAVAANMPPNDVFIASTVGSLAAGQSTTVTANGTFSNTGNYSVVVVADLNNQVGEGPGEANNDDFTFSYKIDKQIASQGSITLDSAGTIDFGNAVFVNWDGANLNAGSGNIGLLSGVPFDNVHFDLINASIATQATITPAVGNVIGIFNADGRRGVLRVDAVNGDDITVTYKSYNP
jgi:ABC-type branched-subunit amino acid transport system substrate-binding protein